jgi:hypothetical protein
MKPVGLLCAVVGLCLAWGQGSILLSQPAPVNRVLELDGNDSWIELPSDLLKDVKNELTVEGWIRWEQLGKFSRFFDFGPIDKSLAVDQFLDTANLDVLFHQPNGAAFVRARDVLRTNRWYHIACVVSEAGTQLYVNGLLAANERFVPKVDQFRGGPNRLGASWDPANLQGHRLLDEFRVWSVARTEEQIRQTMWQTLTGREAGLLGYWNFDTGDPKDLTPAKQHLATRVVFQARSGHSIRLCSMPSYRCNSLLRRIRLSRLS